MSAQKKHYDFIIAGAGAAGLSLLMRLMAAGIHQHTSILLIDKAPKQHNDRTWCFWEAGTGLFEPLVHNRWNQIEFMAPGFSKTYAINPYQYKMIHGIDFYNYCFEAIKKETAITVIYDAVTAINTLHNGATVTTANDVFTANYVFSSIVFNSPSLKTPNEHYLLQHFKGWTIETTVPCFDRSKASFMDFRVSQQHGTTFVYTMPFANNKALIEYTLFTKQLLPPEAYDAALHSYIQAYFTKDYTIKEQEFGIIPMTNYKFKPYNGNVIYIGTIGGQTKGSSGYTFQFIQKRTAAIAAAITQTGKPFTNKALTAKRFQFYDSVLLHLLAHNKLEGVTIFTKLFQKNDATAIFKFLDNETSFAEDVVLISSLPFLPFSKAAIKQLF
jgi:lycopene beta-cyclase